MADSGFLSYIGAATGVIGSVLGYIGYRQASLMKSVDLRLQSVKQKTIRLSVCGLSE